jgi:hypothetical protein
MKFSRNFIFTALLTLFLVLSAGSLFAGDGFTANLGGDFFSRYVWRGMDIGNAPSIQPSLSLGYAGFELGFWGAYAFSNNAANLDEADIWLSWTHKVPDVVTVTALVTDYYHPHGGIQLFSLGNYDDPDGPGAHTLEVGLQFWGPESFPIGVSGYINVYNDGGNNNYFQVDYIATVENTKLNFFVGGSTGRKTNPTYYGTDDLEVINMGITALKEIKMTDKFSMPISVTFAVNPNIEMSYLVLGLSL